MKNKIGNFQGRMDIFNCLKLLIDLVRFYSISTIVGYSIPNPVYTYIYDLLTNFVDNIFK